jgi:hypothetical protein
VTRRTFLAAATTALGSTNTVVLPVHRIVDAHARTAPEYLARFWWSIWPEAFREFDRCGIRLETTDGPGEIRHTAGDRPIFIGLERGVLNLVLTDHLPLYWDNGRALAGITVLLENMYHVSLIAARYAHANQVPYLSVNTCVHEILHAVMQDIFETNRPGWLRAGEHESRIDSYATALWLFGGSAAVRDSARVYLKRLRG